MKIVVLLDMYATHLCYTFSSSTSSPKRTFIILRLGSHLCEMDADFSTSKSQDRRLWPAVNGAGSHFSGATAEWITQGSCASLAPFQVWIQPKIRPDSSLKRRTGTLRTPAVSRIRSVDPTLEKHNSLIHPIDLLIEQVMLTLQSDFLLSLVNDVKRSLF